MAKKKGLLFDDTELESYSSKYVEFLVGSRRCEGKPIRQYENNDEWWIELSDFRFINHCQAERKQKYSIRVKDISGYCVK